MHPNQFSRHQYHPPLRKRRHHHDVWAIAAAIIFVLAGLVLAAYVGIWLMLVGGLEQGIHGLQASPIDASAVAWGAVRVFFFEFPTMFFIWLGVIGAKVALD